MESQPSVNWKSIIERGIESDELDYKAAQSWRALSRSEKAKFVRHCLALANTKGGYIVVGVGEDSAGKPSVYTGLTDEQLKSFDPTDVGNFINFRVEPPIDFDIVRPTVNGKSYAVFVVRRFKQLPHVCTQAIDGELYQGCFYIRTVDASSRVAYRAGEIHAIVQRALRNQREILGRMLRGLLYEKGMHPTEPLSESLFNEELRHAEDFLARSGGSAFSKNPTLEIRCRPAEFRKTAFHLPDIRGAVEESLVTFGDEPVMVIGGSEETYFTNVSLRSLSIEKGIYFQAFRSGHFHYVGTVSSRGDTLSRAALLHRVAACVHFLGHYYDQLGYEDELLTLTVCLNNAADVSLDLDGHRQTERQYICRIPKIQIEIERSAADLFAGVGEHATRLFKELCLRFNLPESQMTEHAEMIDDYLGRRV
jgi:hypothetical protein